MTTSFDKALDEARSSIREAKKKTEEYESSGGKDTPRPITASEAPRPRLSLQDLPTGVVLDLSHPETEFEGISFTLPTEGQTIEAGDAARPPSSLTAEEWITVALNSGFLRAVRMDTLLKGGEEIVAQRYALAWKTTTLTDGIRKINRSLTETKAYKSESEFKIARAAASEIGATVSTPYVSVAAKVSDSEREARHMSRKTVHLIATYLMPQVELELEDCTALSPSFVAAVRAAMARPEDERMVALRDEVFALYGHAVPERVVLGGALHFESQATVEGAAEESEAKIAFSGAVTAAYGVMEAGIEGNVQSGEALAKALSSAKEEVRWNCIGGDTSLNDNPGKWRPTTKNPNNWAIIERKGAVSLIDLLERQEPELGQSVRETWDSYRKSRWGKWHEVLPVNEPLPLLDNASFVMGSSRDSIIRYIHAQPKLVKRLGRHPVAPDDKTLRNCDPAILIPASAVADPKDKSMILRLVFTGQCLDGNGEGAPIYWLCHANSKYADKPMPEGLQLAWGGVLGVAELEGLGLRLVQLDGFQMKELEGTSISQHPASFVVTQVGEGRYVFRSLASLGLLAGASSPPTMDWNNPVMIEVLEQKDGASPYLAIGEATMWECRPHRI